MIAGAWQEAHEIVQDENSALAAWLHGIVHILQGDLDNARYWYRKAGRVFPGRDAVQEELAAARRAVQAKIAPIMSCASASPSMLDTVRVAEPMIR